MALPVVGLGAAIAMWVARQTASVAAKASAVSLQSGIAAFIFALNVALVAAYVTIIFEIYEFIQGALDWFFDLATSPIEIVSNSIKVVQSIGVWDGLIDGLTLVLPILISIMLIKLSKVLIRFTHYFNEMLDRIIKTALSFGV